MVKLVTVGGVLNILFPTMLLSLYKNAPFAEFCSTVPADLVFFLPPSLRRNQKKCDFDGLTVRKTECCSTLTSGFRVA